MVLLSHASWCFDIRVLLEETNLLPASGQDGCVESCSPGQIPKGCLAAGHFWSLLPSTYLFLPLIHLLCLPSQGLFHIEMLEIPPSVKRHPLLALSSHFRRTRDSDKNEYNNHLNLSGACKMTSDWFQDGTTLTGKMFISWRLKMYKHGFEAILQRLSGSTEQEHACKSWYTGQALSSMFSIQITIMFSHWTAILF